MSYQVLARKWRPKNFHELVGQDHVSKALISGLDNDRLHHAYLFTGTRGVGKTTIARIIAKCLNCEQGVTSRPCGQCTSCREIDEGRFVDLIEVDAASRTKVEDTRELLDNVQYAPSRGRYKVYLIDEVHMLSTHSFNALLKTLEEPPAHVKFLLATTDPQKLPVTVLSRCLQFNLKNMPPERVVEHLTHVLSEEQVPFEDAALWQLGRAADGSMRDALSLTDQAIAYGQGQVMASQVSEMLGLVDHRHVGALIEHLIQRDAQALLQEVVQLSEQAADFATILSDMALYFHRMAVAQVLPDAVDNSQGDREQVLSHAARLTAEDVQLYYQIAIKSQEDMPLAPDARTGFEMALIRMVAFAPQGVPSEGGNPLPAHHAPMPVEPATASPAEDPDAAAKKKAIAPASDNTAANPPAAEEAGHQPQTEPQPQKEPQLRKEPQPPKEPEIAEEPQTHTEALSEPSQESAPTVQNARAALGGGLRTVKFPSVGAEKARQQAEKTAAEPESPAPAAFVIPESQPAAADIPPWEERPVMPEQPAGQPLDAPAFQASPPLEAYDDAAPPAAVMDEALTPAPEPEVSPAETAPETETEYQSMMPEPVSAAPRQAPALRDHALPEASEAAITPLVGPCPKTLQENQDWLEAFPHLPLRGLDRSLAKNAALIRREGQHLHFALKAVTENFLTPERQQNWQQSIQQLFSEPLTIEITDFSTDLDTPEDYEAALRATRQQQAEALFASDPLVQGLQQKFGAQIQPATVEPLI